MITSQAAASTVPRHVRDKNSTRINRSVSQSGPDGTAWVHCEAMPMGSMIIAIRRQATCDSQIQCSRWTTALQHRGDLHACRVDRAPSLSLSRPAARRWSLTRHRPRPRCGVFIQSVCRGPGGAFSAHTLFLSTYYSSTDSGP